MSKSTKKLPFGKRIAKSFRSGVIVSALMRFADALYKAARTSFAARIFLSYDKVNDCAERSLIGSATHSLSSSESESFRKVKHKFASSIENSFFISAIGKLYSSLLITSLASYGVFAFSFGFYVVATYLLKKYSFDIEVNTASLATGIALIAISVVLFMSKKSLAQAISGSVMLRFIFFDVLNLRSVSVDYAAAQPAYTGISVSFLVGMISGTVSIFVPAEYVVIALAAVISIHAVLLSPEAGIIGICLLLPFLPTMALAVLTCLVLVSCIIKFFCGKRVFKISFIDVPVFLFLLLTFFGGIFSQSKSSTKKMLLMVCFIAAYFIVKNLIRSYSLLKKCLSAVAFSGAIVSLYGIFENFIGSPSVIWQDMSDFGEIKGRVVSTFANPNVLGEYLILIIPVTVALALTAKSAKERFAFACGAAFDVFCLVLTWSRGAWLGFAVSVIVFILLADKRCLTAGILLLPPAAVAISLSSSVTNRIASIFTHSDTSSSYRIGIWRGVIKMLGDVFPYGIGIGEGAFAAVYPSYALRGIETAPHSHSLYLQILTELGISGAVIFAAFVFVLIQMNLSHIASPESKSEKLTEAGIFCGLLAFLVQGMTDYVWYNYRVFLMFWIMTGLSAAAVMLSKNAIEESGDFFY